MYIYIYIYTRSDREVLEMLEGGDVLDRLREVAPRELHVPCYTKRTTTNTNR